MMNLKHVKYEIVTPALKSIGLASPAAINSVTGTGNVESKYIYTKQIGGGPALGFWQMEPKTHDDCWKNFLLYRKRLKEAVLEFESVKQWMKDNPESAFPSAQLLESCPLYAAAMCRVKYFRSPKPLPSPDCALALCQYWKLHYNSLIGKGQVDSAHISIFQQAIEA